HAELGGQILLAAEEVARAQAFALDVVLDLDRHLFAGTPDSEGLDARSGGLRGHDRDHLPARSSTTRLSFPSTLGRMPGARGTTRTRRPSCWRIVSWRRRAAAPSGSSTSSLISSMPLGSE